MLGQFESFDGLYARVLQGQNQGIGCPYCNSLMGHYGRCPLINRPPETYTSPESFSLPEKELRTIESYRQETPEVSEGDKIILHSLGVRWDNPEDSEGPCFHPIC